MTTTILALVTPELREQMLVHAEQEAPDECCGLLVRFDGEQGLRYVPAVNDLKGQGERDQFRLDPLTFTQCEDAGEVLAVVHSHPNASAHPSMADRKGCEATGLPWLILGWPSGAMVELGPKGWAAPLLGREYYFGVLDCYTLLQDFYRRDLAITLPDFDREGFKAGEPLYRRHMQEAGFELVADGSCLEEHLLQRGDVLLLRVQSPDVDNHVAAYLGDGHMMHHLHGQLSRRDRFDHPWQRRCFGVARHKLMMGKPWSGPQ